MDEQFLVGGDPAVLRAVTQIATDDPSMALLDSSGPPQRLTRLVVRMSAKQAADISSAFGPTVLVEADAPVDL